MFSPGTDLPAQTVRFFNRRDPAEPVGPVAAQVEVRPLRGTNCRPQTIERREKLVKLPPASSEEKRENLKHSVRRNSRIIVIFSVIQVSNFYWRLFEFVCKI